MNRFEEPALQTLLSVTLKPLNAVMVLVVRHLLSEIVVASVNRCNASGMMVVLFFYIFFTTLSLTVLSFGRRQHMIHVGI